MKLTVDPIAFGRRVASRREKLKDVFDSQGALAKAVGMRQQGIDAIEKGKVKRPRLLRELAAALRTTEDWLLWRIGPETLPDEPADIKMVPEIDWVSAGKLAEVSQPIPMNDVPLLAFSDLGRGDFFALKVQGDSMDRISPEGSKIIVDRSDRLLVSGRCYVFAVKGETTYKRWPAEDPPYLQPWSTNPLNKPVFVRRRADVEVVGRVKRTMLDM